MGIDETILDNDFLVVVSSGIICRHLHDTVTVCKYTEDINDGKFLTFSDFYLFLSNSFWQAFEKWKSVISSDKIQVMFDHSKDTSYDWRSFIVRVRKAIESVTNTRYV